MDGIELKVGEIFDVSEPWYRQIDEILEQNDNVALAKVHEDDGFILYFVFQKVKELWQTSGYSSNYESAKYNFDLKDNYIKAHLLG